MKIAVYGICKNEVNFVRRFTESVAAADYVIIGDTGSTDGTLAALAGTQAVVHHLGIRPWRFDVARNAVLSLVPLDVDVCIKMDLDETMQLGWRTKIEEAWLPGTSRLRYLMADNYRNGEPSQKYHKSDVHARVGYFWQHPCHESLVWYATQPEITRNCNLIIEHRQDTRKTRSSYLPLLEQAVLENPGPRHWFWLGREYAYVQRWDECEQAMLKAIGVCGDLERAWAMRFIAGAYAGRNRPAEAGQWYLKACAELPSQREPWMHLAHHYHLKQQWVEAYAAAIRGLAVRTRPSHYLVEPRWWGHEAWDLAGLCAWKSGHRDAARKFVLEAIKLAPTNPRLRQTAARIGVSVEVLAGV